MQVILFVFYLKKINLKYQESFNKRRWRSKLLSRNRYIHDVLNKYDMTERKSVNTTNDETILQKRK